MFFTTHIQGLNSMMPPPKKKKKIDYEKSKKKHQNKKYNTSSNKMLTLGIGAVEKKQNKVGVKLQLEGGRGFILPFFLLPTAYLYECRSYNDLNCPL